MEKQILTALKALSAQVSSMDKSYRDMTHMLMTMSQQIKHLTFLVARDAEPFNKAPKGERSIVPCERCGAMAKKESLMTKTENRGPDIVSYRMCKKCFYGKRDIGHAVN